MSFVQFVKCWRMFLELKPKGMYLSSEKEKENGFLVYRSTKREARTFDVLVMQSNEQKCLQNCCFFFLNRRVVIVVVVALKAPSQPYDEYVCHLHREISPLPPPPPRGANTDGTLACQSGHQRCLVKMISMTMKNSGSIQKKYL